METQTIPLDERQATWFEAVKKHQRNVTVQSESPDTKKLLTEGYQLFFETIDPIKDQPWFSADQPNQIVYVDPSFRNPHLTDFSNLFSPRLDGYTGWGIQFYGYTEDRFQKGALEASIRLSCNLEGTHGEKHIRVILDPHLSWISQPRGQMFIQDITASWLRKDSNVVKTAKEQSLHHYPGLSLSRLTVALADSFVKNVKL